MAILHSVWTEAGELLLWGEQWCKVDRFSEADWASTSPVHPLALPEAELADFLRSFPWLSPFLALEETKQYSQYGSQYSSQYGFQYSLPIPTRAEGWIPCHSGQWVDLNTLDLNAEQVSSTPESASPSRILLAPWTVTAYRFSPSQVWSLLLKVPLAELGRSVGEELRYWSHVARWVLDLSSRSQFIPTVEMLAGDSVDVVQGVQPLASWQVRLEQSDDRLRFDRFVQQMPPVVQWVIPGITGENAGKTSTIACPLPVSPRQYLSQWLNRMIDQGVRAIVRGLPTPPVDPLFQFFWHRLSCDPTGTGTNASSSSSSNSNSNFDTVETLSETWTDDWERWSRLVQRWSQKNDRHSLQPFRACFKLHPPGSGVDRANTSLLKGSTEASEGAKWLVEYGLQGESLNPISSDSALDLVLDSPLDSARDSALNPGTHSDGFIPAAIVWQTPQDTLHYNGYSIPQPQEILLRGLGLAIRLYPFLEASLDTAEPLHCELSTAEAYFFIKTVAPRLGEQGLAVILPLGLGRGVANRLGLQVKAELAAPAMQPTGTLGLNNLLQFRWELCLGGQTFSKAAFDRLVAQDTPLVQVNGEWLELRTQDVIAAREFFKRRKDQPNLSLEDALRLSTGDTPTLSKLPVVNFEATGALQSLVTTLTGTQPVESLAAPPGFQGQLRPYQERGAGWLTFLHRWNLGACLADDMGLGKTVQFIAFLLNLYDRSQLEYPYLLICPTSVLGNWEREIKRFAPKLKVWVHHGEKRQKGRGLKTIALNQQLVLTSYSLVHRDLPDLKLIPWQGVVLDEAQNIKNAEAKQSVAVRELTRINLKNSQSPQAQSPQAEGETPQSLPFRIALTGTPVENHLTELWSIMEFLNPGYLGTKAFFQRRFTVPIERYGDRSSLESLRSLVQPFILRRLKTDRSIIQDLPEKQEMTVFCGLSAEQGDLYQTVVDDTLKTIEKAEGIEKHGLILGLLTKLKQICNHPSLYLKETLSPETVQTFAKRSSKIQRLESLLDELLTDGDRGLADYAFQNRALLFTQFAEWGKLLQFYFEQRWNQEVLFLYGSTSKNDRQRLIDRFQEDPQAPRLFILSLKAGGVGLNLTRANHVFHIDRWWNPAVENQATDRAFRIGQNRKVQVHKFVCSGTLEERIHDLMETKKALAEQVVGTGESWLTQLDTDQLRDLLLLNRDTIEEAIS